MFWKISRMVLVEEIVALRKENADLEIRLEHQRAQHERENLEIQHMVGLEKNRQEVELAQAKRESLLVLREENLAQEKDRFAQEMQFIKDQFSKEMERMSSIYEEIITRMPNINVALTKTL